MYAIICDLYVKQSLFVIGTSLIMTSYCCKVLLTRLTQQGNVQHRCLEWNSRVGEARLDCCQDHLMLAAVAVMQHVSHLHLHIATLFFSQSSSTEAGHRACRVALRWRCMKAPCGCKIYDIVYIAALSSGHPLIGTRTRTSILSPCMVGRGEEHTGIANLGHFELIDTFREDPDIPSHMCHIRYDISAMTTALHTVVYVYLLQAEDPGQPLGGWAGAADDLLLPVKGTPHMHDVDFIVLGP